MGADLEERGGDFDITPLPNGPMLVSEANRHL
jgi:hypothetical protein